MSATPKIAVRGLKKAFGGKVVLDGIDLDIGIGESVVVIGGSGTGKSVLVKCIIGLMEPDSGSIKIDDREVTGLPRSERENASWSWIERLLLLPPPPPLLPLLFKW